MMSVNVRYALCTTGEHTVLVTLQMRNLVWKSDCEPLRSGAEFS
jgi:hypothetical protein